MLLFVQEGCKFCDGFKETKGLVVGTYLETKDGPRVSIWGVTILPPIALKGLPTLVDGENIIVGLAPISEYLEKVKT